MAYTFFQFKKDVRALVFPVGEARNLVIPHNKSIVDALVDIQTWVPCLQYDNTQLIQHCSTHYRCGITSFDFPSAMIKRLSVIDKIDPDTGKESADAENQWCSEVEYDQVDACYMQMWFDRNNKKGACLPITSFFAIPDPFCRKRFAPVPTDEGVPEGLPLLPLGYHYPQTSTDAKCRALRGKWAIERGRVLVAPYIQSTETLIVRWDGTKTDWADNDLVDQNPKILKAVKLYLQWETSKDWGDIKGDPETFHRDYQVALADLMRDCREQTRVRGCEPSFARASTTSKVTLYFNDEQTATANCPAGQIGDAKQATVAADTVSSSISKADANSRAQQQARAEAESKLVCADAPVTYWNTQQTFTATCTQTEGAPVPDGTPVLVTIEANKYSSIVSQAAADAAALAASTEQAKAQLSCTYWNSEQTFEADCGETATTPAHTFSSNASQEEADALANNAAKTLAEAECPTVYRNTRQALTFNVQCLLTLGTFCNAFVSVIVDADKFTSTISQADANQQAINAGQQYGGIRGRIDCRTQSPPCSSPLQYTYP